MTNEMTAEEASVIIGNIPIEGDDCYTIAEYQEAKARAIQALEAQPTDAKKSIIKSALKGLVKMQIEQGSVGFAVDNDHDHDCCWDDVLAWIEAQPCEAILDKIKAEITEKFDNCSICEWFEDYDYDENDISEYRSVGYISDIIDIIDKYSSESEDAE